MFNKGRPKNHKHAAYFTYDAPDGRRLTYAMTTKGPLVQLTDADLANLSLPTVSQADEATGISPEPQSQISELPVSQDNPEISLEYNNDDYNIEKIQNFSTETFQNLDMENNYIEMCTYQCNYQFLDDNIYNTNHLPQDINLDSPMLNSPFSPDTNNFMIYQDSDNDDSKIDFNNKDIFNF